MYRFLHNFLLSKGRIWVEGEDKIKVLAAAGSVSDEDRKIIKENKTELIKILKENDITDKLCTRKILHNPSNFDECCLSYAQSRLWFLDRLLDEKSRSMYNMPVVFELEGDLNIQFLEKGFNEVIKRHWILRTAILESDCGEPKQFTRNFNENEFLKIEIERVNEDEAHQIIKSEYEYIFDLSKSTLLRVRVLDVDTGNYLMIINQHHIITDARSIQILLDEVFTVYNSEISSAEADLPEISVQYSDFASWKKDCCESGLLQSQVEFWKKELEFYEFAEIPPDYERANNKSNKSDNFKFKISSDLLIKFRELAKKNSSTMYMAFLSIFYIIVKTYSRSDDIIFGTPVSGRENNLDLDKLLGFFVNTLPVRLDAGNLTLNEMLCYVRDRVQNCFDNQSLPFDLIINELDIRRETTRNPLFQCFYNYMFISEGLERKISGLNIKHFYTKERNARFDFTFYVYEKDTDADVVINYNKELFMPETVSILSQMFLNILEEFISAPNREVSKLNILPESEKLIIDKYNKTEAPYPSDKSIIDLFESQTLVNAEGTALIENGINLTYSELNVNANRYARYILKEYRDKFGQTIASPFVGIVLMTRSIGMVTSILALQKLGGSYVAIERKTPPERMRHIADDCNASVIITDDVSLLGNCSEAETGEICCISSEKMKNGSLHFSGENFNIQVEPGSASYIVYTSGTTGLPKGVVGSHRAALNRFNWMWREFPYKNSERSSMNTMSGFVRSVWELFVPLLNGTPLVIASDEIIRDKVAMGDFLVENKITRIVLTPTLLESMFVHWKTIADRLSLRYVFVSGEKCPIELAVKFNEVFKNILLINLYGASENASDVTCYDTKHIDDVKSSNLPVGRPVYNTKLYVLDKHLNPLPRGVIGTLYVSGCSLAEGYYGKEELTRQKFLDNPFNKSEDKAYSRMYDSGDLAKWSYDGNMELFGRADSQIKIRGFRIELSEIEQTILKNSLISQCVVLCRKNRVNNDLILTAFIVLNQGGGLDVNELNTWLLDYLPDYMIPSQVVCLPAIPMLGNAKIDKKRMLEIAENDIKVADEDDNIANRNFDILNNYTSVIKGIWQKVLGHSSFNDTSEFFSIGGHSILGINLLYEINLKFDLNLKPVWLFQYRTVLAQAESIMQAKLDSDEQKPVYIFNDTGSTPPLILIHPALSGCEVYWELSSYLSRDIPVLGIESYNLFARQPIYDIRELAAKYIDEIKKVFPEGPYFLGGSSRGGMIAYEMARQMSESGDKIINVYMIDSTGDMDELLYDKMAKFYDDYGKIALKSLTGKVPQKMAEYIERDNEISIESSKVFQFLPYSGEAVLFKANKLNPVPDGLDENGIRIFNELSASRPPDNWWGEIIDKLTIIKCEENHYSINHGESIKRIAEYINNSITNK